MDQQADVIVLGMGTGGEEIAGRLAMAGLEVVGIEPELVGGECAYWACIPTKMMVRAAGLLQEGRRINGVAGEARVEPDWAPLAKRIREEATGDWDDTLAVKRFQDRGGRFVRGHGRLIGPRAVIVGEHTFTARRGVVVVTGSRPDVPPIPGLPDVPYWTSRDAVRAPELPGSLLVLGGGTVGCELGQVYSRFGAKVTVLERGERLLSAEEPEAGEAVRAAFEAEGVQVRTQASATRVRSDGGLLQVTLEGGGELAAERLLVAVGRSPNIADLGLKRAGLDTSSGSIAVDERMRAGDGIWAMGDVTGKGLFTHVALHQAHLVEADILGRDVPRAPSTGPPAVTFTDPEAASVGMREAQARQAGMDVAVTVKPMQRTFRGWIHGSGNGGLIKLVADRDRGVLVGATCVGPHAGEVIGLLSAAVQLAIPLADLGRLVYAFPTFYGGVGEALGAYARALVQVLDPEARPLLLE